MRFLRAAIPWLVCFLMTMGGVGPARAAVVYDAAGNKLTESNVELVLEPGTGEKKPVWLAYQDCRPTERPADAKSQDNRDSGYRRPIRFMEEFGYAARYERKGLPPYVLLVRSNKTGTRVEELVGWVDGRFLVESTTALKDSKTKVFRKGMIIYTPERQDVAPEKRDVGGKLVEQGVKLRRAPVPNFGAVTGEMRLFTLFFVFAETADDLLLGLRPQFEFNEEPAGIVLGWAPKKRVCQWATREAFDWAPVTPTSPRTVPGQIYRTAEDARDAVMGRKAVDPRAVEGRDRDGNLGAEWAPNKIRYPLLTYDASDRVSNKLNDMEMFRVGVVGGFAGSAVLDPEALNRVTDELAKQAQVVEILFVIDETESMILLMPIVAEMVQRIVDRAVKRAAGSNPVRVAVAYYGDDYPPEARPATPAPFVDARAGEASRLAQAVRAHGVRPGGDIPERVFYGIREAIRGAGFSEFTRKMVIVLGDMGNKPIPGDPTTDNLADLMVTDDGRYPIDFYALQVCDPENPANQPYAKNFQSEMREIVAKVKQRVAEKYRGSREGAAVVGTVSDYYSVIPTESGKTRLLDMVDKQYQKVVGQGDDISRRAAGFSTDFETVIGPELEKALKDEYGYDITELRKTKGFQLFTYGYIWENNEKGQRQIRPRMLINGQEASDFLRIIEALTSGFTGARKKSPADVIREIVEQQAGQSNADNLPLKEVIYNATGLRASSALLDQMVGDLSTKGLNTTFRRQQLRDIEMKKMKLEDMLHEMKFDYDAIVEDQGGQQITRWVRKGNGQKSNRKFQLKGDNVMTWYWVDLEEEWP